LKRKLLRHYRGVEFDDRAFHDAQRGGLRRGEPGRKSSEALAAASGNTAKLGAWLIDRALSGLHE
jgi:hypothetical protein